MIKGAHTVIRSAGVDDAEGFQRLYHVEEPVSALLDVRRELVIPTLDELRELFGGTKAEQVKGLSAIENLSGTLIGFCSLRPNPLDALFGQAIVMFYEQDMAGGEAGREALGALIREGFERRLLHKVMANCMPHETGLWALYSHFGFHHDGTQRDVFYSRGRWYDLGCFTLLNPNRNPGLVCEESGIAAGR